MDRTLLYVSEKPIYKYNFPITPINFNKNTQCKIIKHEFVKFNPKTLKTNIKPDNEDKLIDAVYQSKQDEYTERGHGAGTYLVTTIDSVGKSQDMTFKENEYYFLLTDPPTTQQKGGKRKTLSRKRKHKKIHKSLKNIRNSTKF